MFATIPIGIILAVAIWHPRLFPAALALAAVFAFLGLAFGALGLLFRPTYRNKALFRGTTDVAEDLCRPMRALLRGIPPQGEVVAEVLPGGTLWKLNGQPVRWREVTASPVFRAKAELLGIPGQLPEAERLELKMNAGRLNKSSDGFATLAFGALGHASVCLFQKGPLPVRLAYVGALLLATLGSVYWSVMFHRRLNRDIAEGVLELVGDRQLLRHSRVPWTVKGEPAKWRKKGRARQAT
jgi:hypothetical protein